MGRKALFTFLFFLFLLTSASAASAVALNNVAEDADSPASVMIGLRTIESLIDDLMTATIGAP